MAEESGGGDTSAEDLPPGRDGKALGLLAVWLQDLTIEIDRALPPPPAVEAGARAHASYRARAGVATTLRATAEGFALALRHRR